VELARRRGGGGGRGGRGRGRRRSGGRSGGSSGRGSGRGESLGGRRRELGLAVVEPRRVLFAGRRDRVGRLLAAGLLQYGVQVYRPFVRRT